MNQAPPTEEEIESHRKVMQEVDQIYKLPPRDYSDEGVIKSLTEPMDDTGGTALGELRSLRHLLNAFGGTFFPTFS